MKLSLWHRIALPAALIALILITGMLIVAVTAQDRASQTIEQRGALLLEEQTERFLGSLISGVSEGTDAYLALAAESLALIAEGQRRGARAELDELLNRLLVVNDSVVGAWYMAPDGAVQALTRHTGRDEGGRQELAHLEEGVPDPQAGVQWLSVRDSGWSLVGRQVVDAVVPLETSEGGTGYLGITLSVGNLARHINKRLPLPGSYFFIMNEAGELVAAPPHSRLELTNQEPGAEAGPVDLTRGASESLKRALVRMADGQALLEQVTLRGDAKYLAYEPLGRSSWRIGLVVPISVAHQLSSELVDVVDEGAGVAFRTMLLWALLLLVVIIVLATALSRRLVRPLAHVSQVAESVAAGDLARRVRVSGSDEIARLGHSFNTMTDRLSDLIQNLEARVRERTAEADEARLRAQGILESSPVGIAFFDGQQQLQEVNPAFRRLFRWQSHDVARGRSLRPELKELISVAATTIAQQGWFDAVWELTRRDGTPFTGSVQGSPSRVDDADGGFILVVQDISEQRKLEQELERQASHDQLTGALNRWRFTLLLEQAIESAQRYGREFSVILFDVDHFKPINDYYGHNVGDDVLKALSSSVQEQLRSPDSMARWGGEEFILLLPETDAADAVQLAERLREQVSRLSLPEEISLTISVGVAQYRGEPSADELVRRADEALYSAKHQGRNAVVSAS